MAKDKGKGGKPERQPTNGPYAWGNGPQPKPKGWLAKIIEKAVKGR